ncbi:hypothetical protein AVEN_235707-1 [Araneus ventricosus]|uniref:Reverse transcriptase domain-containing protein n=1 Tax=Araneus ventricosus TaxID=182803 RepID=A0A4Y2VF71_ARAVE|nr:hypothetical protein AVEN_235707-1 [Araneus ventricosus]
MCQDSCCNTIWTFRIPLHVIWTSNAAAMFQKFIYHVLRGMGFCVPYFGDVLVASESDSQYLERLKQVFLSFEEYGVRFNASKSVLGKSSVKFLGHLVTPGGITPLSEKLSVVTNFPESSTVRELCRFLTLINFYRHFVPNIARTQAVLNVYLKGPRKMTKYRSLTHRKPETHLKCVSMTWKGLLSCIILLLMPLLLL